MSKNPNYFGLWLGRSQRSRQAVSLRVLRLIGLSTSPLTMRAHPCLSLSLKTAVPTGAQHLRTAPP